MREEIIVAVRSSHDVEALTQPSVEIIVAAEVYFHPIVSGQVDSPDVVVVDRPKHVLFSHIAKSHARRQRQTRLLRLQRSNAAVKLKGLRLGVVAVEVAKIARPTSLSKPDAPIGPVAELVGIEGGVVSGVINLESSGVEAPDWRPRHDKHYHEA